MCCFAANLRRPKFSKNKYVSSKSRLVPSFPEFHSQKLQGMHVDRSVWPVRPAICNMWISLKFISGKVFWCRKFSKLTFFLPKLKSCFYSFFVSLREFHDLEMLAYFITVSPIYGLLFSPFSAQCLASWFSCQDLGWSWIILNFLPGSWIFLFVGKILDFLDFLPRSWQLILPRNPRKIKILPRNPRPCQWNSEKKTTVIFITIN